MASSMALPALLVVVASLSLTATAQNLGDIRLTGNGATSTSGRLEVFYGDYGWGTVNYKSLDENIANVACKQLGYEKALSSRLAINTQYGVGDTSWILLNGSRCTGSELHILRCYWKNLPCLRCSHDDDTAIECSSALISNSPYNGQVRLSGTLLSAGVAEIYLRGTWENICYDNVQSYHADTICRQLGYTNSREQGIAQMYGNRLWLKDFNCTDAQPCFTYCFNQNSRNSGCSKGPLNMSCEFRLDATSASAGSPSVCAAQGDGGSGMSCSTITTTEVLTSLHSATTSESPTVTCIPDKAKTTAMSRKTLLIILGLAGGGVCGSLAICFICCWMKQSKKQHSKARYQSI